MQLLRISAPDGLEAAHLAVLRLLQQDPSLTQRELSEALGVSLGKTNYLLRALLDKGLLKIENFRRSDNKIAYAYILTPTGLKERLRLTRAFLMRKETEFEQLRAMIAELRNEVQPSSQEDTGVRSHE